MENRKSGFLLPLFNNTFKICFQINERIYKFLFFRYTYYNTELIPIHKATVTNFASAL